MSLAAQDDAGGAVDKALDLRIQKVADQPRETQDRLLRELAVAVSRRPDRNLAVLADNLAVTLGEVRPVSREAMQLVATTLADALRRAPQGITEDAWSRLARFERYDGLKVSLDDSKFRAAIAQLKENELKRQQVSFRLKDLNGREWDLKSLRGKVVLVNFWATWCPPCRREFPELASLWKEYGPRGLVILSITQEETPDVKQALPALNILNPVLLDPGGKVQEQYREQGFPAGFVYGRDGKLVLPYAADDVEKIGALIRAQF